MSSYLVLKFGTEIQIFVIYVGQRQKVCNLIVHILYVSNTTLCLVHRFGDWSCVIVLGLRHLSIKLREIGANSSPKIPTAACGMMQRRWEFP